MIVLHGRFLVRSMKLVKELKIKQKCKFEEEKKAKQIFFGK